MKNNFPLGRERGATLIVALILLLLITVVAATTLTNSTFMTAITGNVQQREVVFRVAESAVEQVLALPVTQLDAAEKQKAAAATLSDEPLVVSEALLATPQPHLKNPKATIRYLDDRPYYGAGEQLGSEAPVIKQYEVSGVAETSSERTKTTVVQGISRVLPMQDL